MKMSIARKMRVKTANGVNSTPNMDMSALDGDVRSHIERELQCDHVSVSYERLTPLKAEKMLNANNINRKLRIGVSEAYARDMIAGQWTFCTTPIVVYDNGNIADGQHRLWAIVDSGRTQSFVVMRGLRQPEGLNIDRGLGRNLVDSAHISGIDKGISTAMLSAARSIAQGTGNHSRATPAEQLSRVKEHREAAAFAVSYCRGRKLCNGAVYAAVGRAWYLLKDKKLAELLRFCEVLRSGQSNGIHESAAVTIRNYLIMSTNDLATSATFVDTMKRVQRAIKRFIDGKQMMQTQAVDDEDYPLQESG